MQQRSNILHLPVRRWHAETLRDVIARDSLQPTNRYDLLMTIPQDNIAKMEAFFKDRELPTTFRLSSYELILDPKRFVDSHIKTVKAMNGKDVVKPYYDRLQRFAKAIQ